ncbi:hypothetical protein CapIbe_019999 [Capra ibex]
MELSLGQWDISVTWINRRMLLATGKTLSRPWKLKKKTQSWLSRWFNDRMNKDSSLGPAFLVVHCKSLSASSSPVNTSKDTQNCLERSSKAEVMAWQ